jgi:hypothetical protein
MAKKDDLWLVTHRVTAERLTPEKEGWGFGDYVQVALALVAGWALVHYFHWWFFGH